MRLIESDFFCNIVNFTVQQLKAFFPCLYNAPRTLLPQNN